MAVYMFGATVVIDMEDTSSPAEMLTYATERANHFERRGDLLVGIVARDGGWTTQKSSDLARAFRKMAEKYAALVKAEGRLLCSGTGPAQTGLPSTAEELAAFKAEILAPAPK